MARTLQKRTETGGVDDANKPAAFGGVELLVNWNSCLADFYARRVAKYWVHTFELAGRRSPEGLAESVAKFESDLLHDYAAQVNELRRIVFGSHGETRGAPDEQYEERLLKAQKDAGLIIEQAKVQAERILRSAKSRAEQLAGDEAVVPPARKRA